jgi:threonine/homoserine/homoserine lactone efflux protein
MTLETFIAFCAVELVLCLTPGPAVLYVISTALARGPRAGLAGSLGIVAGNTFYFVLSGIGVAAVILASNTLFTAVKWIGATYLIYLGLRMLFSRRGSAAEARPAPIARAFARGFAVQGANPKALAFFIALLPQFIDPTAPVAIQVLVLGVASQVIEIAVLGLYVWVSVRARAYAAGRFGDVVRRLAGGFLIAAGARLAFVRTGF